MRYVVILLSLYFFTSCSNQKDKIDKTIIPVSEVIGSGEVLNLSDFAKSVKYIPLETNDSVLIGRLEQAMSIGGRHLISDAPFGKASQYHIFDEEGNYVTQVGSIGHGPGQYSHVKSVDIDYQNERILLEAIPKCFEYDWDGVLIDEKEKLDSAGYYTFQTVYIGTDLFLSTISSRKNREFKAFLYVKDNEGLKITRTYPNHFQQKKVGIDEDSFGTRDGKFYRYKNQVRYWRSWDDTIFTFNEKLDLEPAYIFDMGTYKAPMEWMSSLQKDYAQAGYVFPQRIIESDQYLFIHFNCGRHAPEKYEYEQEAVGQGVRTKHKRVNVDIYGLFDKNSGNLILMNQPVKHKYLGFRNDIDDGPCFWPKYISPKDEMVTWFTADKFLEIYEQLPNPSAELKAVAEKLNPDDNPVLMVVQLK